VPTGQLVVQLDAAVDEKKPLPQAKQAERSTAAREIEYKPGRQFEQVPAPVLA